MEAPLTAPHPARVDTEPEAPSATPPTGRRRWPAHRWLFLLLVIAGFLLGLRLLARGTHELQPLIEDELLLLTASEPSALGAAWLASYVVLNGSLVAAVALTLFDAGLVGVQELLMLIFGSRLGAAGIVLLVGALDYLQARHIGLARATRLGLLSFLATFAVCIPALGLARLWVAVGPLSRPLEGLALEAGSPPLGVLDPLVLPVLEVAGPWVLFLGGLILLAASLKGFDRLVRRADVGRWLDWARPVLDNRWAMFAGGLVVTLVTTSVAVSIAAAVPLVNRDHVQPNTMIAWILGAGVGTFGDTLLIAAILGDPRGVGVVLVSVGAIAIVTLGLLLVHDRLVRGLTRVLAWTTASGGHFAFVVGVLVAVPALAITSGLP